MKQMIDKYIDSVPTPEQLKTLKAEMDNCSDEQLAEQMEQRWHNNTIDTSSVSQQSLDNIYDRVTDRLGFYDKTTISQRPTLSIGRRILAITQWAAILLLPITIALALYIKSENEILAKQTAIFTTNAGQQGTLALPDGTEVNLNEQSQLSYQSGNFSGKERNIYFDGEAFFHVAKDPQHAFVIHSGDINVRVLGTKFNFMTRNSDSIATLTLVEGSVRFETVSDHQSIVLKAGQQIVYNKRIHHIKVTSPENITDATAWQRKEIVFRSESLNTVLNRLADNYHMKVNIAKNVRLNDRFTGVMSSTDLEENLKILEISNQLQIEVKGKTIYVRAK